MVHYITIVLVCVVTVAYGLNDGIVTPRDYVYGAGASQVDAYSNGQSVSRQSRVMTGKMTIDSFMSAFQPFEVISAFMDQLADLSPQAVTKVIGQSVEGRDLKEIKIGVSAGKLQPIIAIGAASHGNDSTAPTSAIYIANQLITGYKSDPWVKKLLDTFEVRLVPVANPDGYHYARTVDPNWSKTRSTNKGSKCLGTNVNRNWDDHWMQNGSSSDPCNMQYAGKNPFSTICAHIYSNNIFRNRNRIKLYVSLYGNGDPQINLPYGYTNSKPKTYKSLLAKGKLAAKAMAKPYGTVFQVGSTAPLYGAISGESTDWAYDTAGIPYTYTFTTRKHKKNSAGRIPVNEIKPIAVETWAGVKALAMEMMKENEKDNLRNLVTGCKCSAIPPK